jgi:phage terminase small subunit
MFNGTKAATMAGFSEKTAYSIANKLLKIDEVKAAIDARMEEMVMPAREVLMRMSDQGRSTMGDFIVIDANGKVDISIAKGAANNKLHLIKDIKRTTRTRRSGKVEIFEEEFSIELHDAHAARVQLGKYHKLFNERLEVDFDWRKELEEAGLNPSDEFNELVKRQKERIAASARSDDGGSDQGSESPA